MEINRTKNATRNIIFGIILKIYQLVVPFMMRTAMIYLLGVEYLGLNSLFTSILQVLNLAELGVGSAMVFSMYKPITEDDNETICALMNLYKIYYRVIGAVVLLVGCVLLPFIPNLINGKIPNDINIYFLYLMNLVATVLSYWLFAYKNSILQAYQRVDVISKVMLVTETIKYVFQLLALAIFNNYYYFVTVILITQIVTNIITAIVSDKMYPQYKADGKLSKEKKQRINQRIRDLFTSKVGSVIVNSVDNIVISSFLGLTALAMYQNYFYLITAVIGLVAIIFNACTAGIGNSLLVESKEKNFLDLQKFTFIISWIAGICTCCLLCLIQPFIKVWIGEKMLLSFSVVICFCIYYFVYEINQLLNTYKDAAGIWHEDRFRPLITALTNLILNLIMVRFMGIYGVILSTVISILVVGMPWLLHNLFNVIFEREYLKSYISKLFLYMIVVTISCALTYFICQFIHVQDYLTIIIRGCLCLIIPNIIYFIVYNKMPEFMQSLVLINNITKGKIKFIKNIIK